MYHAGWLLGPGIRSKDYPRFFYNGPGFSLEFGQAVFHDHYTKLIKESNVSKLWVIQVSPKHVTF